MNRFIENLETRTFCSASIVNASIHEIIVHAAVHATPTPVVPLKFTGTAVHSTGKLAAILAMTVTKTDKGFNIAMDVTDPATPTSTQHLKLTTDNSGNFSYDRTSNGTKFHLQGQLGTGLPGVTGTWTQTGKNETSTGTFALSPMSKPSPAPTPAPSTSTSTHYQGTATDNTGKTSSLTMDLFTIAGGNFATVKHPNSDGTVDTYTIKIVDSKFSYNGDGKADSITGTFSADKSTVTGYWVRADGLSYATFSLTRS